MTGLPNASATLLVCNTGLALCDPAPRSVALLKADHRNPDTSPSILSPDTASRCTAVHSPPRAIARGQLLIMPVRQTLLP